MLDPFEVMDRFGTDALRYYCFREVSFGQDGGVSTITFGERYESELANELGNLASRTTNMLGRYTGGKVPTVDVDPELAADFDGLVEEVGALLDQAEITQALERIWQRVRRLNRYVEENAPWQLAKDPEQADKLNTVLRSLAEGLRVLTVLLTPYIPESAEKLLGALGAPDDRARGRPVTARTRAGSRSRSSRPSSRSRSDRQPHPPRPRARARGRARRRRRAPRRVTRILTIGMDAESRRAALRAAETFPEVYAAIGQHPNEAERLHDAITDELREQAQHPRCLRDRGDRAWTTSATTRPAPTRSAPSRTRSRSRTSSASRWSSTPARPRTTRSTRWHATPRASR